MHKVILTMNYLSNGCTRVMSVKCASQPYRHFCYAKKDAIPEDKKAANERHKQTLETELGSNKRGKFSLDSTPNEVDILIIGGGVIGSSIAYWLRQETS